MRLLGELTDVDVAGAKSQRRGHDLLLVGAFTGQVKVNPIGSAFLGAGRGEPQADLRPVPAEQHAVCFCKDVSVEQRRLEPRQPARVAGLEGHRQQSSGHRVTVGRSARVRHLRFRRRPRTGTSSNG